MILIVALMMAAGIWAGAFIVSRTWGERALSIAGRVQQAATTALLLFMGFWLGSNPEFWGNIRSIGIYGILFALVCVAGSVAAVYFIARAAFKEDKAS